MALEHQPRKSMNSTSAHNDSTMPTYLDDLQSVASSTDSEPEYFDQTDIPRHERLGRELRILTRSRTRLFATIGGLVIFWILAVVAIAMIRTSGFYRNPFSNDGNMPSYPY